MADDSFNSQPAPMSGQASQIADIQRPASFGDLPKTVGRAGAEAVDQIGSTIKSYQDAKNLRDEANAYQQYQQDKTAFRLSYIAGQRDPSSSMYNIPLSEAMPKFDSEWEGSQQDKGWSSVAMNKVLAKGGLESTIEGGKWDAEQQAMKFQQQDETARQQGLQQLILRQQTPGAPPISDDELDGIYGPSLLRRSLAESSNDKYGVGKEDAYLSTVTERLINSDLKSGNKADALRHTKDRGGYLSEADSKSVSAQFIKTDKDAVGTVQTGVSQMAKDFSDGKSDAGSFSEQAGIVQKAYGIVSNQGESSPWLDLANRVGSAQKAFNGGMSLDQINKSGVEMAQWARDTANTLHVNSREKFLSAAMSVANTLSNATPTDIGKRDQRVVEDTKDFNLSGSQHKGQDGRYDPATATQTIQNRYQDMYESTALKSLTEAQKDDVIGSKAAPQFKAGLESVSDKDPATAAQMIKTMGDASAGRGASSVVFDKALKGDKEEDTKLLTDKYQVAFKYAQDTGIASDAGNIERILRAGKSSYSADPKFIDAARSTYGIPEKEGKSKTPLTPDELEKARAAQIMADPKNADFLALVPGAKDQENLAKLQAKLELSALSQDYSSKGKITLPLNGGQGVATQANLMQVNGQVYRSRSGIGVVDSKYFPQGGSPYVIERSPTSNSVGMYLDNALGNALNNSLNPKQLESGFRNPLVGKDGYYHTFGLGGVGLNPSTPLSHDYSYGKLADDLKSGGAIIKGDPHAAGVDQLKSFKQFYDTGAVNIEKPDMNGFSKVSVGNSIDKKYLQKPDGGYYYISQNENARQLVMHNDSGSVNAAKQKYNSFR